MHNVNMNNLVTWEIGPYTLHKFPICFKKSIFIPKILFLGCITAIFTIRQRGIDTFNWPLLALKRGWF